MSPEDLERRILAMGAEFATVRRETAPARALSSAAGDP